MYQSKHFQFKLVSDHSFFKLCLISVLVNLLLHLVRALHITFHPIFVIVGLILELEDEFREVVERLKSSIISK